MDFLDENEMYNIIQVLNDWTKAYCRKTASPDCLRKQFDWNRQFQRQ